MMKSIILASTMSFSGLAHADSNYINYACDTQSGDFSLLVYAADENLEAKALLIPGGLQDDAIDMKCQIVPGSTNCTEARAGDGKYLASIHFNPATIPPMLTGELHIEQAFPLEPLFIDNLDCQFVDSGSGLPVE